MKNNLIVMLLSTLFLGLSAFKTLPMTNDETAIKEVIVSETTAFFALDYKGWANLWLQSPHDSQAWNNSDGSVMSTIGWDKVSAGAKEWIDSQKVAPAPPTATRDNWDIHISGDMAAVSFTQYVKGSEGTSTSKEFRTMVRKDGQWKISSVQAFWDYKNVKK